jgi:DNA-binding CsgD family transcriptional regulator
MKTKKSPTWLSYMDTLKHNTYEPEQFRLIGFDDFIKANGFADSFFMHSIPFIYLLDYRSGLYINMSENFAGYRSECFLKEGLNHTLEIYNPPHLKLFNNEIFPDRLEVLKQIKPEEHKNYVFSYNQSIRNRNGTYENFLQRSCFLSDEAGNPLFSMGMIINTNHFGNDCPIIQTVDKIDFNRSGSHDVIFKKVYYLNEEDKLFTKREIEVLKWMSDGLSSKMIAHKMFLSEHTVINHRRNMQDKTNKPNAIALISFAIKNGLI